MLTGECLRCVVVDGLDIKGSWIDVEPQLLKCEYWQV